MLQYGSYQQLLNYNHTETYFAEHVDIYIQEFISVRYQKVGISHLI